MSRILIQRRPGERVLLRTPDGSEVWVTVGQVERMGANVMIGILKAKTIYMQFGARKLISLPCNKELWITVNRRRPQIVELVFEGGDRDEVLILREELVDKSPTCVKPGVA